MHFNVVRLVRLLRIRSSRAFTENVRFTCLNESLDFDSVPGNHVLFIVYTFPFH